MNALKHTLKQYHKDQISLSNLKIKLQALSENIKKMKEDKKELDSKFEATLERINNTKNNYEFVSNEVIKVVNRPNAAAQQQIYELKGNVADKENELGIVLVSS
jgi:hypothetical protein